MSMCCLMIIEAVTPGLSGFYPNGTLIDTWTLSAIEGAQVLVQDSNRNLWIGDALSTNMMMFNMATMTVSSTKLSLSVSGITKANVVAFNKLNNAFYTAYYSGHGILAKLNMTATTTANTQTTAIATQTTTLLVNPSTPTPTTITPQGLVIDYTNTVYISESSHKTIYTVTSSTATNTFEAGPIFSPYQLPKRLTLTTFYTSGLTTPTVLAVDRTNNLYICDSPTATTSRVLQVSKSAVLLNTLVFSPIGLSSCQSIAVDGSNNVYVLGNTPQVLLLYNPITASTISITATNIYGLAFNPLTGQIMLNTKATSTALTTFSSVNSNLVLTATTSTINISATVFSMDSIGNYYVTNPSSNSIAVYSYSGNYLISLTTTYASIGSIGVSVDGQGNLWTLGGYLMTTPTANSEIIYMQGLGYSGLTYGQHHIYI